MKISLKAIIIGSVISSSLVFSSVALAATYKDITEPTTIQIEDSQIIQVLPEGGFIYNSNGTSDYNEEMVQHNNSQLMTYQEHKEHIEHSLQSSPLTLFEPSPGLLSADPFSQKGKVLADKEIYVSQPFSGSGWRFSNLKFIAANGTGRWLKWTSIYDGGRVGNYNSAESTYSGRGLYGVELEVGRARYVDTRSDWLYYYTYNPVPGTRYIVENR